VRLSCDGEPYHTVIADKYRADVEATGVGSGFVGFSAPLPCDAEQFDPKRFEARLGDGTILEHMREFLAWDPTDFRVLADFDLTSSPVTTRAYLELTSRCNLRCVYCRVSQPGYIGQDLEAHLLDNVLRGLRERHVELIQINGHGETTIIPGWHDQANFLSDQGFNLEIITNLAHLLGPEELAAMARMRTICVSIDTHRPDILREVRRRVSLGNMLINMTNIAAKASELCRPKPTFIWSCVISDKVAPDFLDYVRFGMALGVKNFFLCNLTKYDDIEDAENVNHVTTLPDASLTRFAKMLDEACEIVGKAGGQIDIASGLVDSINEELTMRGLK
jgi:hypothetical protein